MMKTGVNQFGFAPVFYIPQFENFGKMSKDLYQFGRPVLALWLRRGSLKDLSDFYSGVKYEFLCVSAGQYFKIRMQRVDQEVEFFFPLF